MNQLIFLLFQGYVLCYFIGSITVNAMSITDLIYGLAWYELPRNERYAVEIIIRRAQKPVALTGLGLFACSLETYAKVIWTIFEGKKYFLFLLYSRSGK